MPRPHLAPKRSWATASCTVQRNQRWRLQVVADLPTFSCWTFEYNAKKCIKPPANLQQETIPCLGRIVLNAILGRTTSIHSSISVNINHSVRNLSTIYFLNNHGSVRNRARQGIVITTTICTHTHARMNDHHHDQH